MGLSLVLFVALASTFAVNGGNMGSKGIITLKEGSVCKVDVDAKNVIELKDKSKDEVIINATLNVPVDLTDKLTLFLVIDKWEKSSWQKDFMKINGKFCEKVNQLVPGFVSRLSKCTKPTLNKECPFKKGQYQVKDLANTIDTSELKVPTVPYGQFRFTLQVKDDNKVLFCAKFDSAKVDKK